MFAIDSNSDKENMDKNHFESKLLEAYTHIQALEYIYRTIGGWLTSMKSKQSFIPAICKYSFFSSGEMGSDARLSNPVPP